MFGGRGSRDFGVICGGFVSVDGLLTLYAQCDLHSIIIIRIARKQTPSRVKVEDDGRKSF